MVLARKKRRISCVTAVSKKLWKPSEGFAFLSVYVSVLSVWVGLVVPLVFFVLQQQQLTHIYSSSFSSVYRLFDGPRFLKVDSGGVVPFFCSPLIMTTSMVLSSFRSGP